MLVIVYTIPKGNFCNYSISPYQWSARHTLREKQTNKKQKQKNIISPFAYCHWKETQTYNLPT